MANRIELNYNGETYTLEFSRRVILLMEDEGVLREIDKDAVEVEKEDKNGNKHKVKEQQHPIANMLKIVRYAFKKNHSDMSEEEIDGILDVIPDLVDFCKAVVEMFNDCVNSIANKKENPEGNLSWGKK